MADRTERVPESSPAYGEFARLYALARGIRPTGADRWNRQLFATTNGQRGCFDTGSGAISVDSRLLGDCLTLPGSSNRWWQAQALAAVLHSSTQAGLEWDAPGEPNAVRSGHSLALADGFAQVRTAEDFEVFAAQAGRPGLTLDNPPYDGALVATQSMLQQASGLRVGRPELIDRLAHGPVAMQFDHLAEAVVQNRLAEVAPLQADDRRAVRAELIGTMLHPQWPVLAQQPAQAGQSVADEIGTKLNAKVDEIRRSHQPAIPAAGAESDGLANLRFLTAQAPAGGAVANRPILGHGARRVTTGTNPSQRSLGD